MIASRLHNRMIKLQKKKEKKNKIIILKGKLKHT